MSGILQSLVIPLVILAAFISVVLALAFYRYFVAREQDFHLHFNAGETPDVGKQTMVATRLNWIDRWGKLATVVTLIYFLIILVIVLYRQWQLTSTGVLVN